MLLIVTTRVEACINIWRKNSMLDFEEFVDTMAEGRRRKLTRGQFYSHFNRLLGKFRQTKSGDIDKKIELLGQTMFLNMELLLSLTESGNLK